MRRSSLAASVPSMAFSESHIGPNGPCLSSRLLLLLSFFLATHNPPLPETPQFREQTSVNFGPGHIWKRTCKRKRHRPQSTRSGRGRYESFASSHETTVCGHTAIEH